MPEEKKSDAQDKFNMEDTLEIPAQFLKALANDESANSAFDKLSTPAQREFIDWVAEAKDSGERVSRSKQAIAKIKAGETIDD